MKKLKVTVENLPFILEVPANIQTQTEDFLKLANEIPLNISINGNKYVLMQEGDLNDLLTEEYDFDKDDLEEKKGKTNKPQDYQGEKLSSLNDEDSYIALITEILDEELLGTTTLSIIKDVVEAHLTIATVREIFGGEEE